MTELQSRTGAHTDVPQVIDFELTDELKAFQADAREYAETELAPFAEAWDREARFPRDAIAKAAARGYLKVTIPTEYGGTDLGNLASCVMLEEINAACPSTGVTVSVHNSLVCSLLAKQGSHEQKERYFPKLRDGEWIGAYCLSEAGSGSDAAALTCAARDAGDHFVIDGPKLWITTGSEAALFVVFARTGEDRVKGITAFLVEREWPGVGIGKKERKLGIKASPTVEILLEGVKVPKSNVLGEVGRGFNVALDTLDGGRLGIASQSLGIARHAIDTIREHLRTQVDAKGRPTAHQADQWELADLAADLDACRMLTWRAAVLRDRGLPCGPQAAMAKLKASLLANRAARSAVSILGPAGLSGAAERLMRDARICEIYEGVTDIQRLVIARGELAR
ncbi:MAG: acyl-CoA dehydrogenase family protein [Planctomycetes bacterium]|nr:acyl-CoA dehydrogenase family protein [Planctomycetota bacterium]